MLPTAVIEELRPRGFAIAYRMLGSVGEAEDVVQEALLRLHDAEQRGEEISSPRAWLATVVTRLAIDELRSARSRRESYFGEWLPEPLITDALHPLEPGPAEEAETADSLSLAFLVVLETLSPEQRAVFLLRDVFDYEYGEIAEIIGKSPDNVRQLASRARRHVEERKPRFDPSPERREALAERFLAAVRDGELEGLEELLAEDVSLHGDGGGNVPALKRAIFGKERVMRTLRAWARQIGRFEELSVQTAEINGQPGALYLDGEGRILGAVEVEVAEGKIQTVRSVVNPEKIAHLGEIGDVWALFRNR